MMDMENSALHADVPLQTSVKPRVVNLNILEPVRESQAFFVLNKFLQKEWDVCPTST